MRRQPAPGIAGESDGGAIVGLAARRRPHPSALPGAHSATVTQFASARSGRGPIGSAGSLSGIDHHAEVETSEVEAPSAPGFPIEGKSARCG